MSRPDEGLIHQWLDGECTPEESARIEQLVATDAEWAAAVAEARGLIAASSRIVQALDAVPHARPNTQPGSQPTAQSDAQSRAAAPAGPTTIAVRTRRGLRVRPWMGVAAGLVLVAGTAYVLREESVAPFGVVTVRPPAAPVVMDTAPGVQMGRDTRSIVAPAGPAVGGAARPAEAATRTPSVAATADAGALPPSEQAPQQAPVPVPVAPPPAAPAVAQRAEGEADARRSSIAAVEDSRRAPSRAPSRALPMASSEAPAARAPLATLDGCWRVSAPPALVGVLVSPMIRRSAADTLVLVTPQGDVTVVRSGDVLRGELEAKQESCRAPE